MWSGLRSGGRGERYTWRRGLVEAALRRAYAGDWPGRLWGVTPGAVRVGTVQVTMDVPAAGEPRRLRGAFVSDLHVGPTTAEETLRALVARLRDPVPDLLILGGDYVFLNATRARCERLARLVAAVGARHTLAVWGNHDLWTEHDRLQRALRRVGVRWLVNEGLRLPGTGGAVYVHGLDDPGAGDPSPAPAHDAALRLGVCHSPDGLPYVEALRPQLFLCGHTHGGQVALPGGRPLLVPGTLGKRWPHGVHQVGPTRLVVSRGVGGVELPVRVFAPPDVVRFEVRISPPRPPSPPRGSSSR